MPAISYVWRFFDMKINFVFLFLIAGFCSFGQANKVLLSPSIPKDVKAGTEFFIEITIDKGAIESLGRFEMALPNGFAATPKKTANGEFRFIDQKVIFQWIKLPFEEELVISFNIQVAPNMDGFYVLRGQFFYIDNNERMAVEMYPHIINIGTTSGGNKEMVMINAKENELENLKQRGVSCIRQKPYLNEQNEVIVNLLVNKGNLTKFGKIQEEIPYGYTAVSIKSKNSIFVFSQANRQVKFMWMNMPVEPQFVVSYKLVPIEGIPDAAFIITGKFYYTETNVTKTIETVERGIDLSESSD